ncbi:hypothetical protein DL98DRAFT_397381, partial [Cadophora sp. DSE1049]
TFRVKGIPLESTHDDIESALKNHNELRPIKQASSIFIKSLAIEAHGRSKVATISFKIIPNKLLRGHEWTLDVVDPRNSGPRGIRQNPVLNIDDHFHGLTVLCSPPPEKHQVDVIAISGLGGHAYGSFKERGSEHMWLSDSLPKHLTLARVIIYGYESGLANSTGFQNLDDLGNALQKALQILHGRSDLERKPIIFIAHSLGGLIVKEAIIQIAESNIDGVLESLRFIYGAMFFGVPNRGLDIKSFTQVVGDGPNRYLVESLGRDNSQVLDTQCRKFSKAFDFEGSSEIYCFYETRTSNTALKDEHGKCLMTGEPTALVSKGSATHCRSWENSNHYMCPIDRDHSEMVKFSANDIYYDTVLEILKGMSKKAAHMR